MTIQQQGRIIKWQEGRGTGFIETEAGESILFHVSELKAAYLPKVGDEVIFTIGKDSMGRIEAQQIQEFADVKLSIMNKSQEKYQHNSKYQQQRSYQAEFEAMRKKHLLLGIGFYAVLILLAVMGKLSWLFIVWYILLGLITYLIYARDKLAAQRGRWRIPESTLHILSVLGGWVGAMIAQNYLRHKSKKSEFRMTYYATILINLAGLLFVLINKDSLPL